MPAAPSHEATGTGGGVTRPTISPGWWAAIFALVFFAYLPALDNGFIWDDDAHLTSPALASPAGLARIWSDVGATQQYYPLLHSAFWIEHLVFGRNPRGYHVVNIVLHATAVCLLALLLRRIGITGAVPAALLFAVHPVHAESVAWISEQKNTLSAIFYFGAALAFSRFSESRRQGEYALATLLFFAGLLTKTVVATLPGALLVLFWWRRGRIEWRRDGVPLLPWLVVAAAAGLFTAQMESVVIGAEGPDFALTWLQRCLLAGHVIWFYLAKLIWPAGLTFIYPRWQLDITAWLNWLPLVAVLALLFVLWRIRSRGVLSAMLIFIGTLFPVLGFLDVYPFQYSFVADHFQYLASAAVFALAATAVTKLANAATPIWRRALTPVLALSIGALATATANHAKDFRNNETLFRATIARNPGAWMAHNNLGRELMVDPSRRDEAVRCFEAALALRPFYYEASNNLGLVLTQLGRAGEAIPHLERAVGLKPNSHQAHNNLAIALASNGRVDAALGFFRQAAALNPTSPNIQENWAKALTLLHQREEAALHFLEAERLRGRPAKAR
ncbi:MAG: tetratricopeptide repeat protein [Opitutaceae bacterium]|nr:tetratricopeptide repeat protein [Opitutaceae bacterium]